MLSDFRFRRGGVLTRVLEATTILAILIMGGCKATNVVTIGPPAQVAFTVQPGNVGAGSSITPAVVVSIEDSHGHVVPTATNQVTIAIGTNPASGTLSGTAMVTAVAGVATFSNLSINNVGTGYTLAASATGLTGATSSAFSVVGPPTKLGFTVQPSNVGAGSSIAPAVAVSVEDANGNVVPTATNAITVAIGTNPASGTLGGTATASAVNGVATFANLNINKVGTGYTLTANTTGLTGATSGAFNVTPGAAAKLVFTTQPTNTTAGAAISPAVVVTIEDSLGNVATSATNSITMGIGTGSGSLLGTTSVNAASGVATFSNLSINVAGAGYTLAASATGLTAATSSAFSVTVGAAAKVVFTTEPSNVAAGLSIAPAVVVSVEDAVGNVVPTAANSITVAIGANPASGTLSGTATVAATAGVATFSNLSINKIGTGYTLTAASGGLAGATSTAFNVTVGVAAQLVFTTQPTNTTAGVAVNPAVKVTVEDSQGNVVNNATNSVTIAIGNNPASGTLSGTATVAAVAGVATFSNLSINAAGTGYTLTAASGSLTGATSSSFNILVGAASKLVFTTQPTSATAGVAISPAVLVTIEDNQGNVVNTATTSVSMAIGTNPTSAALNGTTTVAAVAGVATFPTLNINSAANGYTLVASVTGLSGATSSPFNISAAAAAKLAFTGEPINTVVSTDINPSVTVSIEDSFGNVVTTASTPSITLAIGANPGGGMLGGTVTASPSNGVATFSNLTINTTGNGYTLTASASGLTGATSSVFNIIVSIGPPAKLAFTVEPTNAVAGVSIAPAVQVSVEDSNGNTVPTATNMVTLSFGTTPPAGAVLSGTLSVAAVSGVAKFTNLSVNVGALGYSLQASSGSGSGSLTGATSTTFNITAASAAKLAFTTQPVNVVSLTSISPAVAVSVEDTFGNLVASATNQITVAIQNNPSSGVLGGTLVMNASGGVATFSNLTIDKAGTNYTLSAASSPLAPATSGSFNVTAGAAAQLAFTAQPTNVAANASITPAVQVSIEDAQGNVTSATTQVTVALGAGSPSGTLSGTVAVNAVSGVATFSTLSINNTGTGYSLQATASGLTSAVSNSFNVTSNSGQISGQISLNNPCGGSVTLPTFTVTINTTPTQQSVQTDSSGNYSFTSVPNGTYTITPSISGAASSVFYPAHYPGVVVNSGSVSGENFNAEVGYDVSGTVSYSGSQTGQTYLYLQSSNCGGFGAQGTSITQATLSTGSGAYTIHSVPPGNYTLYAWMDSTGVTSGTKYPGAQGQQNTNDPTGSTSNVSVTTASVTGVGVTMTSPTYSTPSSNPAIQVFPSAGGVAIFYQPSTVRTTNGNKVEDANEYVVQWAVPSGLPDGDGNPTCPLGGGTGGGQFATLAGSHTFYAMGAHGGTVWILNNTVTGASNFTSGQSYCFQARSFNTLATTQHPTGWSNYNVDSLGNVVPVTIVANGAALCTSNCTTVSGTVTIPSGVTPVSGAPLYVGFYQQSASSNGPPTALYATEISPGSGGAKSYSITIPSGSNYYIFGILDQNNDGQIDAGDVTDTNNNNNAPAVTLSGSTMTVNDNSLPATNSVATVQTQYSSCGTNCSSYNLNLQVREGNKLPVAVTLYSGPNLLNPVDMGQCSGCGTVQFQYSASLPGGVPTLTDTYKFTVTYSDGSVDQGSAGTINGKVSAFGSTGAVVGANDLTTNLSPSGTSSTSTMPNFTWTFPSNPSNYTYSFYLQQQTNCTGNCTIWQIPSQNSNSNGFTFAQAPTGQITWGTDPTGASNSPSVSALTTGATYGWSISVQDANGNQAQASVNYTP